MESKRQELLSLLGSAEELAKELQPELMEDGSFRAVVGKMAVKVQRRLQVPGERAWELFNSQGVLPLIRMSLEAGWLDGVARSYSGGATIMHLASITETEGDLIARVLRYLASVDIVDEVAAGTYAPNRMTKLFTEPGMRDGVIHMSNCSATFSRMPLYFSNTAYHLPPNAVNTPYAYAEGAPLWEDLSRQPEKQKAFDKFMGAVRHSKKNWFHTFPIEKLCVESESATLLIDVGGGAGHDLAAFNSHRQQMGLHGQLILQDRSPVLANVPEERLKEFGIVEHDFFNPQPETCQHARVYYLRMILHDWPDTSCVTILRHLRDAMIPTYSTLLINDQVLPEIACPAYEAFFDILMMAVLNGKQRTKQNWEDLIARVDGLMIEKIWPIDEGADYESLIEVVRTA